ncbi:MAG: hypothetical protein P1U87_01290 [Verrucomicrobiales bacterium]|nr:hypothetical protein [Verrucomicrobiales bacterium]
MASSGLSPEELSELIQLLERRLAVIGDAEMRENDPDGQLRQLQEVSEAIQEFSKTKQERIPIRLRHFLENSSLNKALDWAKEAMAEA